MTTWLVASVLRLVGHFFYRATDLDIWVNDLKDTKNTQFQDSKSFWCKQLDEGDLPLMQTYFGSETADRLKRDHTDGHKIAIIFEGNIPIGYSLGTSKLKKGEGSPPFLFDIQPCENNMYFYGDFIVPEKRGVGANTVLTEYRFAEAARSGFSRGFGLVNKKQISQQRVLEKHGWKKAGRISFRKYLWFTVSDMSDLKRYCK